MRSHITPSSLEFPRQEIRTKLHIYLYIVYLRIDDSDQWGFERNYSWDLHEDTDLLLDPAREKERNDWIAGDIPLANHSILLYESI